MNWLSVSATFRIKGKPRPLGIYTESWQFAKDKPLELFVLMGVICKRMVDMYVNVPGVDVDDVNEQLRKFAKEVQVWQIVDELAPPLDRLC